MRKMFLAFAATVALIGSAPLIVGSSNQAQAQDRFDRRIEIVNRTGTTIHTVNSTNVGRGDWGVDLLGTYVIPPGRSLIINVEDRTGYCRYDFRAIFADGRRITRHGVNVCEVARWVIG